MCGTGSPTTSFQTKQHVPSASYTYVQARSEVPHTSMDFVFKLPCFDRRAMQRVVRRAKQGSFKKGLLDWVPSSRAAVKSRHSMHKLNRVWYYKEGTTDSSWCQQSFFSGPNCTEAKSTHWENRIISKGKWRLNKQPCGVFPAEVHSVCALNLVFPSVPSLLRVPSLSQCKLVFTSVI